MQAHGADRRLQALPHLLTEPASHLLVHRPERRAVVSLPGRPGAVSGARTPDPAAAGHQLPGVALRTGGDRVPGPGAYARVFRPGRTAAVVRAAHLGRDVLAGLPGFAAPAVLAHREGEGVVLTSALTGADWREVVSTEPLSWVARHGAAALGRVLRHMARVPAPRDLPVRDAEAELAWVGVWAERVRLHLPRTHALLAPVLPTVTEHVRATDAIVPGPGIIHGDLHDAQVLIDDDGQVGILDWDTIGLGEGALDAANVWAHTDLRRLLGHWPGDHAATVWSAVVDHWNPTAAQLDRAAAYRRLLLVRLACQYAFRPAHAHIAGDLAALASTDR